MAISTLIIGKSGSGKSASLRNFEKGEIALINVLGKPLPFRAKFPNLDITAKMREPLTDDKTIRTEYTIVNFAINNAKPDVIVIDDAGYLMTNMFMMQHASGGTGNGMYGVFNRIGDEFWRMIRTVQSLPENKRVYIIMHESVDEMGNVRPKSIGKLIDDKVCLEGMFTLCLRSCLQDGKYVFKTQTDGLDVAKAPMGMFDSPVVDNDLKAVDKVICEYYEITDNAKGEQTA